MLTEKEVLEYLHCEIFSAQIPLNTFYPRIAAYRVDTFLQRTIALKFAPQIVEMTQIK